jgi:hypothetical protein
VGTKDEKAACPWKQQTGKTRFANAPGFSIKSLWTAAWQQKDPSPSRLLVAKDALRKATILACTRWPAMIRPVGTHARREEAIARLSTEHAMISLLTSAQIGF